MEGAALRDSWEDVAWYGRGGSQRQVNWSNLRSIRVRSVGRGFGGEGRGFKEAGLEEVAWKAGCQRRLLEVGEDKTLLKADCRRQLRMDGSHK